MQIINRKVNYRIYPSVKQNHRMFEYLRLHQRLYNCALEERIDAYKKCGVNIKFKDQCKSLTQVRSEDPEYAWLNAQSEQVTLKRLDLAFEIFLDVLKREKRKWVFPDSRLCLGSKVGATRRMVMGEAEDDGDF